MEFHFGIDFGAIQFYLRNPMRNHFKILNVSIKFISRHEILDENQMLFIHLMFVVFRTATEAGGGGEGGGGARHASPPPFIVDSMLCNEGEHQRTSSAEFSQ